MDKTERIIDMMEHPELYAKDDFQQLLDDDDSRSTFQAIAEMEAALELANDTPHHSTTSATTPATTPLWRKIAAAIVGVCLITGMAYAAVVSDVFSKPQSHDIDVMPDSVAKVGKTRLVEVKDNGKTIVVKKTFENATLQQVLHDIGYVNRKAVAFRTDSVRLLRLYYEWDSRQGLEKNIEELNRFEKINITVKGDSLIVD